MSGTRGAGTRFLNLREGEGRTFVVMAAFLFLSTANTTVISAAKNGLFLSVYPGSLIPHAVISAALLTAVVAIVFTGVIAGTARRSLALWLSLFLAASVLVSRTAFNLEPRSAFALYLWLSAVQVLLITHAWDYASDLLTGRQAKRLLPLIGMGASVGAILGGVSVAPTALSLGTANLLLISAALLVVALPLLWAVPEPTPEADEEALDIGAVRSFLEGAGRGVKTLSSEPLLRLLAAGLIALTLTGTLIDLQLKFALQESFGRDNITAIYGLMSSVVGVGTLVVQLWASRVLFPKLGVSFAALLHAGTLSVAAAGVAVTGGVLALAGLQALDDILQFSLQKPVEQVSLLPFPARQKSAALATLGGVLRPLSKATAGGIALVVAGQSGILAVATVLAGLAAFAVYSRHRKRYLAALVGALARHAVDLSGGEAAPLVVDRSALSIVDKGLADPDPTVAVFATSLLPQLPPSDGIPRALDMLTHRIPEVRAEAARVLPRLDAPDVEELREGVEARIPEEESPFVLASLLGALGSWGPADTRLAQAYLDHETEEVRTAATVALGRMEWDGLEEHLHRLLESTDAEDKSVAARTVGTLGLVGFINDLVDLVEEDATRPAAMAALASLEGPAIPAMAALLHRRDLPLPIRRSIITTLATVDHPEAHETLLDLVEEPALGPPALTSLRRLRSEGSLDPVDPESLGGLLEDEVRKGFHYGLVAQAVEEESDDDPRARFMAEELQGLRIRALYRVLRVLTLSHDPDRIEAVQSGLFSDDDSVRSNALELLEGMVSQEEARLVVPFAEAGDEGLRLQEIAGLVGNTAQLPERPWESLLDDSDWWPRALALHALGRDSEIGIPGFAPAEEREDTNMIPLIEKVMILKGSQLFRYFPGSDLAGIASLAEVVHLEDGEMVFEQGDPGDAFYMVVRGNVRITRGSTELAVLGAREGFGEMAILDQEARSATATAAEASTLLRIDRDSFDRLIEQNPSVARGIYRVLTQRLRNTLAQVAAG